jgi:apolipoprotein N-acyltransferase
LETTQAFEEARMVWFVFGAVAAIVALTWIGVAMTRGRRDHDHSPDA